VQRGPKHLGERIHVPSIGDRFDCLAQLGAARIFSAALMPATTADSCPEEAR
jgi:hypothetical protein